MFIKKKSINQPQIQQIKIHTNQEIKNQKSKIKQMIIKTSIESKKVKKIKKKTKRLFSIFR